MSSDFPRITVATDPKLTESELNAGRTRRAAAEALFEAMDGGHFDLDLGGVDHLNAPFAA